MWTCVGVLGRVAHLICSSKFFERETTRTSYLVLSEEELKPAVILCCCSICQRFIITLHKLYMIDEDTQGQSKAHLTPHRLIYIYKYIPYETWWRTQRSVKRCVDSTRLVLLLTAQSPAVETAPRGLSFRAKVETDALSSCIARRWRLRRWTGV